LSIQTISTNDNLVVLDYGCGGSPYRSLFPNSVYKRADFLQAEGDTLDYRLAETGSVNEKDATFDLIISTQVIEHVRDVSLYLAECFRLLKPGGRLYLTTHGCYPDHACPYDFWRWTAEGLVLEIEGLGFSKVELEKQTAGPRALFQEIDIGFQDMKVPKTSVFGFTFSLLRSTYRRLRPWIHRNCDRHFSCCRVINKELDAHRTYTVVGFHAWK